MEVTPRSRDNLQVQVRPWPGVRQMQEQLQLPAASAVPGDPANGPPLYGWLGDLRLRFVFTTPGATSVTVASAGDLRRLGLEAERALMLALVNLLRQYGMPHIVPLDEGVYSLRTDPQDLVTSYLLDRGFWNGQFTKFPQGLLAAMPRRGVLMFVPAGNPAQESALVRQAARALERAGSHALSAQVFRFDGSGWQVYRALPVSAQPPATAAADGTPVPDSRRGPASEDAPSRYAAPRSVHQLTAEDADDFEHMEKVARGQKMLVYSVLGGIVLRGLSASGTVPALVGALLSLALGIYSLLGVARLAIGLRKGNAGAITCMVLSFVPLLNIACWIVLSLQATRRLRAAGWQVGLFGARMDD